MHLRDSRMDVSLRGRRNGMRRVTVPAIVAVLALGASS